MSYELTSAQKQSEAQHASVERVLLLISGARKRIEREISALEKQDPAPYLIEALKRAHEELGETHTRAVHGTYFHVSDEDLAGARAQREAAAARFAERNGTVEPQGDDSSQGTLL